MDMVVTEPLGDDGMALTGYSASSSWSSKLNLFSSILPRRCDVEPFVMDCEGVVMVRWMALFVSMSACTYCTTFFPLMLYRF